MKRNLRCPTQRSGKVLILLLVAFACVVINRIIVNMAGMSIAQDMLDGIPISFEQLFVLGDREEYAKNAFLLTFLVTAIAFTVFVASVVRGAHGSGAKDMKSTPGMAAGSFYIPFYNLYGPYAAMQESWRATLPETTDSYGWHAAKNSMLLKVWWWAWLLSRFTTYLSGKAPEGSLEDMVTKKSMILASNALELGATILAIVMVRAVSARVELKWAQAHGASGLAGAKVICREPTDV